MTKLSDLQLILLSTASQREDGHFLPLPEAAATKPDAAIKALAALVKKKLATEVATKDRRQQWCEDGDQPFGLIITDAGLKAINTGEQPESGTTTKKAASPKKPGPPEKTEPAEPVASAKPAVPNKKREGTKQQLVIDLLERKKGATIQELVSATGWLPHTTRAMLTGLKKKGFSIAKEKVDGATHYRITGKVA